MGALNPWFLTAAVAVGVPLLLHLFHRQKARRISFPALRYLERTEREHARRIKLRQLLLLLARVVVLLLLVAAGARLFVRGRGASHPPTAVVIVLDNSMSSGLVRGETRVLDQLEALAQQTLGEATDEDRFWLIRAGEPWLPALPGGASETRPAVAETDVSAAAGDLSAALQRAVDLLRTAELPAREIHVLSDAQSTAFSVPGQAPAGELPVVMWTGDVGSRDNRAITRIVVGGGLPPVEGQRTEVTVSAFAAPGDTTRLPVRLIVNDRIRGAASLMGGDETSIVMPAAGSGWVQGYADADPDELRADDRRYFAYRSRPAPAVAVAGAPGVFVAEALAVLETAGRARTSVASEADLLIAHEGLGLEERGPSSAALIIPPADGTRLPALNRRLAEAGIPWRYEVRAGAGEADLLADALPAPLEGVRVRDWFSLALSGDPPGPTGVVAEAGSDRWAVEGTDERGRRYLLVASPLDARATSLPVSTAMPRFVDWAASEWAGASGTAAEQLAGSHLSAPAAATHVRFPSGQELEIDGTRTVRGTGEAGFYSFLAGDSVVAVVALNPPPQESVLTPLDEDAYADAIGSEVVPVDDEDDWARAVFRARQGPELWRPLLAAVVILLVLESLMGASGRGERRREGERAQRKVSADGVVA